MVNKMLYSKSATHSHSVAVFLAALMVLSTSAVLLASNDNNQEAILEDAPVVFRNTNTQQTYDLYLDKQNETVGGQGTITTLPPNDGQEEKSAVDGLEFRSAELISDLYVNGTGASNIARLSIYYQFSGPTGSTATATFALKSGDSQIVSESKELSDPCSTNPLSQNACTWAIIEVEFVLGSNGFTVPQGKQLKIRIDADAQCADGQGGLPSANGCDVEFAFGKVGSADSYSRLQIMTNALSGSSVRVHSCYGDFGCNWNDEEKLEWAPNHRLEFREMRFSVEIQDAFGREDIEDVTLIMSTPNEATSVFEVEFDDDDLKLDNNGLVGIYNYTASGLASGEYPVRLEINDVQGHSLLFEHPGLEFLEHDVYLTVPQNQPDVVLYAPGQTSKVNFLIEHTGSASSSLDVVFDIADNLPMEWAEPLWSQASGSYTLTGGGDSAIPELLIDVPEGDLSDAPDYLQIEARVYATNDQGQSEEVAIKSLRIDFEKIDVFAPPRISVYEDQEHQKQIADSTRPEAYDEGLSHYVDAFNGSENFYIDVFNSGFDTDSFKIKILEQPDDWQYRFYSNQTGAELTEDGIYHLTSDIGSTQLLTVRMQVFPPEDRESLDIGLFSLAFSSTEDSELRTDVAFTVHRTFGILAEVIADSDGVGDENLLGQVGPVSPNQDVWYNVRISDSSSTSRNETTWRIINPRDLSRNADNNPKYTAWEYSISNDTNDNIVVVSLPADEYIDIRLGVQLNGQVEAGEHIVYTRIIEEGVEEENEPRYFDLPVKVIIKEDVVAGRIEITAKTEASRFSSGEEKNLEFKITNQNNVELDVVILLDEPLGWDGAIRATSNQLGSDFLILKLSAYESKDFSLKMTAPESLKDSASVAFEFKVTPMNNETPYAEEFEQTFAFQYVTECSGASCLFGELTNPEPQTMVFYVILGVLLLYAARRGKQQPAQHFEAIVPDKETESLFQEELAELDESIPEPVVAQADDDDLELLEELDDI
ncbi:hypothetical protein [Candidatus Poseidonia alphae]|uniref:COG1470 family protein n=1 Tax=Candidatus Poseidonia alphae TaxID=1915863 RepID=UPI0030C72FF0